jgi:NhaA family Na+:H+ antiporter
VALWLAVHASGAHATLTGVLLALTVPARASRHPAEFERRVSALLERLRADRDDASTPDDALANEQMTRIAVAMEEASIAVQSPLQRMEHALATWVTFGVIPVFALCNAGIDLLAVRWSGVLADPVTLGVGCGLVLGKFAGVSTFAWIAVRLRLARLPAGVAWRHILGAAWLTGIGFTMSLFIAQLAFADPARVEAAKLGILLGSATAATIGLVWLYLARGARAAGARDYNEAT